jgi:hypothetical protein
MGLTLDVREQKGKFGREALDRLLSLSVFYHLFSFIFCVQFYHFVFLDRLRSILSFCFLGSFALLSRGS